MGSGPEANRESTLAVRLLEQFLQAGVPARQALSTLASALALRGEGNPSYARVDELARGIAGGLEPLLAQGIAPVVLVEADQAKVLGQAMAQRVEGPLLCLDSVGVDNGDYIDIGAPVAGGAVLPVVIKTLVFNKS